MVNNLLVKLVEVWNKYATIYDSLMKAPVFKALCQQWINNFPSCPGGLVHDAGCGTGVFLESILEKTKARKVIATDISPEMLRRAQKKVAQMPLDWQKRIELRELDLTKDWPAEDFNLQLFQLVLNYVPEKDGGWKGLLSKAAKTTLPGGCICSSILLADRPTIKELSKKHTWEEARKTPISAWPAMYRSSKIMGIFDHLREKGIVIFPTEQEFFDFHKKIVLKVKVIGPIFWGAGIVVKATVPTRQTAKKKAEILV